MKIFIRTMIVALFAMITIGTKAQTEKIRIVETQPDRSVRATPYSETSFAGKQLIRAADPTIAAMVSAVKVDTLRATLRALQNWGSRFLMNNNRKEIACSLANKFLSYGYTDVKLDSFLLMINVGGIFDSSWQYNVVCTLPGSSAPDEIYVVGGHWDSYSTTDPFNEAPGVDDNGTAVAATLEIARVMKQFNYQPEATIQFTLFAAEELGLFGSRYSSEKARMAGEDIRYMLNLDMISNNPDNTSEVKLYQYLNFEWAGYYAADVLERYTTLIPVFPDDKQNSGSDSYPFWLQNFPVVYFEEFHFSPNWHRPSDTLGNCNAPYLGKITGGALATLAELQRLPYTQNLSAKSTKDAIILSWKPTQNKFVKGVYVYRADSSGGPYQKISTALVSDSIYHDLGPIQNKQYYYVVATVNDSLQEGMFSNEVFGARFNFSDTLLVLANVKGNKTTPDSVFAFYQAVLDTIPYRWFDINAGQKIDMSMVSRYRSILWMSNSNEFEPMNDNMFQCVTNYMDNGGNMLFAGFNPGRFWLNSNIISPLKVPETSIFHQLFKADSIDRKVQSMLFRANTVEPGYDTLHIDTLKYMDKNYPGQIYNVEVFAAAPGGTVIYRFDSHFDPSNVLGKMKNRPVGLEYMGNDFKSILLSFPLYYLDTADAHDFLYYVMKEKFNYPVGIAHEISAEPFALRVFPNPLKDVCNVSFTLDQPGSTKISLISQMGQKVATWLDCKLEKGTHFSQFTTASLTPGLYQVVLQQGESTAVRKIIRVR
ncbi:MAG: M20/M25/M40 family metallo-hydrolase [Bacteroidales bacterium]|nr:M20/M25/M40 family metallo-hydrolase [Bacteroidales bacterium]